MLEILDSPKIFSYEKEDTRVPMYTEHPSSVVNFLPDQPIQAGNRRRRQ
jgi:hypothetical protein